MSKAKAKGTAAETAVVNYIAGQGFPGAERRALAGSSDLGDITGIPGLVMEVKNHKSYKFPEWIKETEIEKNNAKADFGILIVKPNGVGITRVGDWWAVMPLSEMMNLIRDAGYGDSRDQ